MLRRRVLFVLLVLLALGPASRSNPALGRDVAAALERLTAAGAEERAAAERELARLLVSADAPLLVAAAHRGSAELRSRIASALMSNARHFAIAAELAASNDTRVADIGADALAGQAAAWLGASDQEPLPAASVQRELFGAFSGRWRLDVQHGDLEDTLDKIARLVDARRGDRAGAPAPTLVLDPRFDAGSARPLPGAEEIVAPVVASFETLVYAAAVTHGAMLDVYGWNDGRCWFLVRPAASGGARSAQTVLREWVLAVQRPVSPRGARAAARALVASGWPAALGWLDARWRERQDLVALDALVFAASRGALESSLASRAGAQPLLERVDRILEQPGEVRAEARQLARALLTIGNLGSEAWSIGFSRAPSSGKSLRCALVASARSCPPDLLPLLEAAWSAEETSSEERCALLRALAALGSARGKEMVVPGLDAAFEWAVSRGDGRGFPPALRALGVREPAAWQSASGLRRELQAELCADALARIGIEDGAERLAAARLAALIAQDRGEELALALLDRESLWLAKAQLRSALLAARAGGADPTTIGRLLVCGELASPSEANDCATATFAREEWSAADWRVAGATIARPGGALDRWPRPDSTADENYTSFLARLELVRDQLLTAQKAASASTKPAVVPPELQGMQAGWVQGCVRTLVLLRARQCEPGARQFLGRMRVLFLRPVQHPLRIELLEGRFPAPSPAILVDVDSREPWVGF